MEKADCIFCKIAAGEIPSKTLYEDGRFAQRRPFPMRAALFIHRTYPLFFSLGFKQEQLIQSPQNPETVSHFHLHMIPRYKEDGQKINWIPSNPTQEELETVRKEIAE